MAMTQRVRCAASIGGLQGLVCGELRNWLIVGAIGIVLSVAGCGGGHEPPPVVESPTWGTAPTPSPTGAVTAAEARELVLEQVVKPQEVDHDLVAFAWPDLLKPGDVVEPARDSDSAYNVTAEEWYFWIDDDPYAKYAHPTRFVFVQRETGEIRVSDGEWWPLINGVAHFVTDQEYWNTDNWVFSNVSPPQASALPPGAASGGPRWATVGSSVFPSAVLKVGMRAAHGNTSWPAFPSVTADETSRYGLIVNGWAPGEADGEGENGGEFNVDSRHVHDFFNKMGFTTMYMGPDEDKNPDRDKRAASPEYLRESLRDLPATGGDDLVVYITAHGDKDEHSVGEVLIDGETLGASELGGWVENLAERGVEVHVVVDACYSGAFVSPLSDVVTTGISATTAGATAYFDVDSKDDPNPEDRGSEFTSGLWQRLNEMVPDSSQQPQSWGEVLSRAAADAENLLPPSFPKDNSRPVIYHEGELWERGGPPPPPHTPTRTPTPARTLTPTPTLTPTRSPPLDPFEGIWEGTFDADQFVLPGVDRVPTNEVSMVLTRTDPESVEGAFGYIFELSGHIVAEFDGSCGVADPCSYTLVEEFQTYVKGTINIRPDFPEGTDLPEGTWNVHAYVTALTRPCTCAPIERRWTDDIYIYWIDVTADAREIYGDVFPFGFTVHRIGAE